MVWDGSLDIQIFASSECVLGEGIYFDEEDRYIYWVDIIKSIIYRKNIESSDSSYEVFSSGASPSAVLSVSEGIVKFLDKTGICLLDTKSKKTTSLYKTPYNDAQGYRANDATVLKDSSILYGTMYQEPNERKCSLYRVSLGGVDELKDLSFNIPNTFIELENEILISDSLEQRVFSIGKNFDQKIVKKLWKDFSGSCHTPDGGCSDKHGNVYISMWDGYCVCVLDNNGKEINRINLPVPRPTNCVLVEERWLYITSAREGLTEEQLERYPLSGNVFVFDIGREDG